MPWDKRKQRRVPLSDRAIAILKTLPTEGDFIIPGARRRAISGDLVAPRSGFATGCALQAIAWLATRLGCDWKRITT